LKNHVIQQTKTPNEELGRHGMKIQEAFEEITSWRISILSTVVSLKEETTKKDGEKPKKIYALEAGSTRPECAATCLRRAIM